MTDTIEAAFGRIRSKQHDDSFATITVQRNARPETADGGRVRIGNQAPVFRPVARAARNAS